jgi:hypothetical protein
MSGFKKLHKPTQGMPQATASVTGRAGLPKMKLQRLLPLYLIALLLSGALPAIPQNATMMLAFSVHRDGVRPATATLAAGKVVIRVANRLGVGDLSLQIVNSSATQVATITLPKGQWAGTVPVTLAAGTYTIRVTNSPSLSAAITVKP